ncbi:LOW QUALITY PROTEIN: uncharacterized protein LOC120275095 [Dioscorea cayenensis subsp. rotundata]|uniref:LOW QUALITY PROTEIN: uncharacterized protein LOC120275095 n=1 Tax=Dioscorea cayennensis subsp. rotundata TaxID=55577 RepID=A0AB40CC89_DIOCR|nr:LOW QUALITY PROTEIN: uncharacterized protein LOC120275095 [Dioscorea cayenensis subsp. rotundata]
MAAKKMLIYSASPSPARQVTPFWKEKYEREAGRYWDLFYRRHKDKFFKDRHYLDKEWGSYFKAPDGKNLVVLEVGCGAGNTVFPLIANHPNIFVHACDFSPRAIDLVKAHKDFSEDRVNAFVCDLTQHNLNEIVAPSSVDVATMIFVLSAVSPEKMPLVLQNIRKVLKPNGHVLLRDYAAGDLAQERFTSKEQQISENFYVRGDGTRAYYFSNDHLTTLFEQNGFETDEISVYNKQMENRSRELVMNRRWIQAVFSLNFSGGQESVERPGKDLCTKDPASDLEIDMSESITAMFDSVPSINEITEIKLKNCNFRIKILGKEHQHTCKSTGLMLWESARFICNVLSDNPSIVSGKKVLELGCGSAGICSMVAARSAELVVATDGDKESLNLLNENIAANVEPNLLTKLVVKKLLWGNTDDIKGHQGSRGGFDVIIGTDVTYNSEAISPLFETARKMISEDFQGERKPALILCHIQRRVDENLILSAASNYGFKLIDKWFNGIESNGGIISSWFSIDAATCNNGLQNAPLTILYFSL